MNETSVAVRLAQYLLGQRRQATMTALLSLFGAVACLCVTWGLSYLVSLFVLGPWLGYQHWIHSIAGIVVVVLLFVAQAQTSTEYWSEYSVTTADGGQVVTFYLPGVGMVSNVNPLAPNTVRSAAKLITDCLLTGPRLLGAAAGEFRKASRLKKIDALACGEVLALLLGAGRKLSFQEIVERHPGVDPVTVFPQLRDIDGVLFLQAEPAGLTINAELKQALRT